MLIRLNRIITLTVNYYLPPFLYFFLPFSLLSESLLLFVAKEITIKSRSRSQVANNLCAKATIPCVTGAACCAPAPEPACVPAPAFSC